MIQSVKGINSLLKLLLCTVHTAEYWYFDPLSHVCTHCISISNYIYDQQGCRCIIYVRIPLSAPSRINSITLTKRVNNGPSLEVNWTIPQTDLAVFWYKLQYKIRGATVWDSVTIRGSPPLTSTILNELHAGTEYSVRVQAVSAAGAGMWSAVQTGRTYKC